MGMTAQELYKEVLKLQSRATILEREAVALGGNVAAPVDPVPVIEWDEASGNIKGGRTVGPGYYVEPVVPKGTARTVTPSETGHTLSIPRPDKGEMFMGYCIKVSDQATGGKDPNAFQRVGALASGADHYFDKWGGFKADGSNWPFAADRFFNGEAYGDPGPGGSVAAPPQQPQPPTGGGLPPGEEEL